MAYAAVITRVATGETRRCHFPNRAWDPPGACAADGNDVEDYVWTDGNDACDCNRADYFARAGGEPDPADQECGSSAYRLDRIETDDGRVIEMESAVEP